MKAILMFSLLVSVFIVLQVTADTDIKNLVCYYDGGSYLREGLSKMTITDLEPALQFCSHLVYGYAGIDAASHELISNNGNLELGLDSLLYRKITALKVKFPHLKILLSVGGDKDEVESDNNKYLKILESRKARYPFVNSAHTVVKTYGFDGLDLAWQFPKNKPKKFRSSIGELWRSFKKTFTVDPILDENAEEHNEEFTDLLRELKIAFRPDGLLLTLTVLPNVNSTLFYDVPVIINYLDFVNLQAFDFYTPDRNPVVADFSAPIYALNERSPEFNINFQVQYWLKNYCPSSKINVGIASYGRAWKITDETDSAAVPPVSGADGAGAVGLAQITGLLSWSEVCVKLPNPSNQHLKGADAPLRRVGDPTKRFGNYAYRLADDTNQHGMWVSYEDPDTASNKAAFVRAKALGGVALVDLSLDDFRGLCSGDKYPILRSIKYRL